jgi:transglutaminase-like putative cysteine protease
MKLQVFHETSYCYEQPVRRSIQMLRMTPAETQRQNVLNWQLDLPGKATHWTDAFGNLCHCLVLENASQDIVLRASGSVDLIESDQGEPEGPVPHAVYLRATTLTLVDASIQNFIEPFRPTVKSRPYIALHDVMLALLERMPYEAGITHVGDSAAQSFAKGKGVCQDHTHVFLACARFLGVPARYVSGYLQSAQNEQVASHAWAEAWVGGRWIGYDVSNSSDADRGHIRLAHGLDYEDASPVRGMRIGGGNETMHSFAKVESAIYDQQ